VTLSLSESARAYLLKAGYTKQYGAREMDRVIQQKLNPLLMREILFGSLKKGGEARIEVMNGDTLILKA
jgi:ATP-dependent Clp protease ATP-binding subunit ClpA